MVFTANLKILNTSRRGAETKRRRTSRHIQRRATSLFEFGLPSPPWMAYTFRKDMKTLLMAAMLCTLATSASRAEDQISLKLTSQSGVQGWTLATAKHSGGEWMNSTLVIFTPSKVEMKIRVSRAFIETWGFADSDKAVVVRSRHSHGPSWIEKFDIATGRVVAECQGSNHLEHTPKWAQAWCDASKNEAQAAS
jgi:hypothetical protein